MILKPWPTDISNGRWSRPFLNICNYQRSHWSQFSGSNTPILTKPRSKPFVLVGVGSLLLEIIWYLKIILWRSFKLFRWIGVASNRYGHSDPAGQSSAEILNSDNLKYLPTILSIKYRFLFWSCYRRAIGVKHKMNK